MGVANVQAKGEGLYGYAVQTAFGTAIADAAAVIQIDSPDFTINPDVKVEDVDVSMGNRKPHEINVNVHTKGSMPVIPIPARHYKKLEIADLLFSHTGQVVEGTLTPFDKTFTMHNTQNDFTADEGHFLTFFERDPASSKSTKVVDSIVKTLKLSCAKNEFLMVETELVGRIIPSFVADPSGTWGRLAADYIHQTDFDRVTVDFGAGAVSFHMESFELVLANEVTPIGQDGAGNFTTYAVRPLPPTMKLSVAKDADYHTALVNWTGKTPIDINLGVGNVSPGTDDGDFDIAAHMVQSTVEKEYAEITNGVLTGTLLQSDDGTSDEPFTIIVADAVDKSW